MKKILSLILSLSLVFSLALPAFAENDLLISPSSSQYEDVAQKLVDLGVMAGYPDGNLYLDKEITRAEFVTMLIRALGYEQIISSAHNTFSDVSENYWAKGYIAVAKALNLVNGVGNNLFAPDKNISIVEAEAILLRIMNYELEAGSLGWPNGYIIVSSRIGLSDNIRSLNTSSATRGEIAQLIENSLTIPFYKFGSDVSKQNILNTYLKYSEIEGVVSETYLNNDSLETNQVKINSKKYTINNNDNVPMLIGQNISGYVDSKNNIHYVDVDAFNETASGILTSVTSKNLKINDSDSYKLASKHTIYLNGSISEIENLKAGMFTHVVLNEDNEISFMYALSISKDGLKITDITDRAIKVETYTTGTTSQYTRSNKHIVFIGPKKSGNEELLSKDMFVSVSTSGNYLVFIENDNSSVSGKLNSISSNGAKIDSNTFKFANEVTYSTNNNASVRTANRLSDLSVLLGVDVTAVFDMSGNIKHIYSIKANENQAIGIVVSKYYTDKQYVQIFNTSNGELETYHYTSKTNRNNSNPANYNDLTAFNGDNGFSFVEINHSDEDITSISKMSYLKSSAVESVRNSYIKTADGTYYISDDTVVIRADENVKNISIVDWNKISSADVLNNVKAIIVPGDASVKAQYIIITEGYDYIGNDIMYGVVVGSEVNLYGEYLLVDTASGEEKINLNDADVSKFKTGDIISYRLNVNDKAVEVKKTTLISAKIESIVDYEYLRFESNDRFYNFTYDTIVVDKSIKGDYENQKVSIDYLSKEDSVKYLVNADNFIVYIEIVE